MRNIEIYEVTITNFKSFGNNVTKIKLNTNLLTLIIGKNLDATINGQIESNGSGKTSLLLDAITFCLYDETISGVKKDKLINWVNKKNMEVSVAYKKDGKYTRIVRYRKNKSKIREGTGVAVYQGNTEEEVAYDNLDSNKDIAEAGTANKQITEKLLEIPFDLFSRIILFSGGHKHFLSLPSTSTTGPNQKDIIEELLGISKDLSEKAEELKPKITINNREIETLKKIDEELNKQKIKIQDQINSIKSRILMWDITKKNNIENIQTKIQKLKSIDYDKQTQLLIDIERTKEGIRKFMEKFNINKPTITSLKEKLNKSEAWTKNHEVSLSSLKLQIDNFSFIDFNEQEVLIIKKDNILKELTNMRNERSLSETIVKDAAKKSSKAADEIDHLQDNKCPYCKQQYLEANSRIAEAQTIINEQYAISSEHGKKLINLGKQIQAHEDEMVIINASLQFKQLTQLHQEKAKRQTILDEYTSKTNIINPYASVDLIALSEELESLDNTNHRILDAVKVLENDVNIYQKELEFDSMISMEKSKMELEKLIDDLSREEISENPHLSTLADLETITFDQSNIDKIKYLERLVNHQNLLYKFLTRPDSFIRKGILVDKLVNLNERLKYYLNILGMPYKVSFTEELEAKISHFGTEVEYEQVSTGQKARINIALSFAFRDVLQDRFGKINLCILDEFLDTGLSTVGVGQAVQMIRKIAQDDNLSMFVISHKDEVVNSFSHVLEVELVNGFSTIKQ